MNDAYTVSVYSTPLAIPFSCFVHTYIVTEHSNIKNRYDVLMPGMFRELTPYDGRIFKNILPADTGFLKLF
jgi:hypothetical protein